MYHCHLHFYWMGPPGTELEALRGAEPLAGMSHSFSASPEPDAALARGADVVFADLRGRDPRGTAGALLGMMKEGGELVLLAEREPAEGLFGLPGVSDIWVLPMGPAQVRFRFAKWQEGHKEKVGHWETRQFLEATINSVPNLIWYKTKDGIHEKVNDSFCRTVGKEKDDVQGRGHAYIWDVEQDDPACIESEAEVMRRRETCVSEERVQTGGGERLLTTYKSPLYDYDGSVMGTVGVYIDVTQERA